VQFCPPPFSILRDPTIWWGYLFDKHDFIRIVMDRRWATFGDLQCPVVNSSGLRGGGSADPPPTETSSCEGIYAGVRLCRVFWRGAQFTMGSRFKSGSFSYIDNNKFLYYFADSSSVIRSSNHQPALPKLRAVL
jgi:hypothetical protein